MWRDVDTCTRRETRGTYSRSSLPGELEFLAADRILSRESRDARDIRRDVLGVTLRERIIHTQCDSSKRGYATDRISAPV